MLDVNVTTLPNDIAALKALLLQREQRFEKMLAEKEGALKNKE